MTIQPVHHAIESFEPELAQKLIQAGYSATEPDGKGISPFEQALLHNQVPLAEWILQKLGPMPPLDPQVAIQQLVRIEKEIDAWRSKAASSQLPAHRVVLTNDCDALAKLSDAALREADANGLTPLHVAILNNNKKAASFLIGKSDPKTVTPQGHSYLHFAAMNPDPQMFLLLLDMPIDIHAKTSQSLTALHYLAASRNVGGFLLLCRRGAHLTEKENALFFFFVLSLKQMPDLLTFTDGLLAVSNAAALLLAWSMGNRDKGAPYLFFVQQLVKQWAISHFAAAQTSPVAHFFSSPLNFSLIKFRSMWEPWIIHATDLSNAYIVGKNTIEKLGRCFSSLRTRPFAALTAMPLHLFNAGAELLSLQNSASNFYHDQTRKLPLGPTLQEQTERAIAILRPRGQPLDPNQLTSERISKLRRIQAAACGWGRPDGCPEQMMKNINWAADHMQRLFDLSLFYPYIPALPSQ